MSESRRKAAAAAKVYLEMRGYTIIEQNWRRPRAVIAIIAQKDSVVHFVEVLQSSDKDHEAALSVTTPAKQKQTSRAARLWVEETKYTGEYVHSAIEIAGEHHTVMSFIENVL